MKTSFAGSGENKMPLHSTFGQERKTLHFPLIVKKYISENKVFNSVRSIASVAVLLTDFKLATSSLWQVVKNF